MTKIRKVVLQIENQYSEVGVALETPIRVGISAAVIEDPWAGLGFVEDLDPLIAETAPILAKELVPQLIDAMGGAANIEAFGKSAIAGSSVEIEHASAMIHTLRFGNRFREAAEGESYLSFSNTRIPAGSLIMMPLVHKNDRSQRSHFLTTQFSIPDAPLENEIIVAIGAASAGRPFARIGDRHKDMATGKI